MHAYLFNARRRNIKKYVSERLFHLALKMPVLVQFAVALLKGAFDFPVYVSQGWLAFWTDLCRQNANVFQLFSIQENKRSRIMSPDPTDAKRYTPDVLE